METPVPNRSGLAGKLGRPARLLLGLVTLWPVLYLFIFLIFFVYLFTRTFVPGSGPASGPERWFMLIFPLHLLTVLLSFGLTAIYIVDIFINDRIARDMKALWAVVLFMGGLIAMPIYWYLYFWRGLDGVK